MKRLTQEELNEIIIEHEMWIKSELGKKTDLSYKDTLYITLSYIDLRNELVKWLKEING